MKRLRNNRMRDDRRLRSLQEEKKTYESISQKQSDLYITPASLKEREMQELMRRHILASDHNQFTVP